MKMRVGEPTQGEGDLCRDVPKTDDASAKAASTWLHYQLILCDEISLLRTYRSPSVTSGLRLGPAAHLRCSLSPTHPVVPL